MNKSALLLPFTFKSHDRQRFWAIVIGAGLGLAGFGYLGDRVGQHRGPYSYVIIVAFLVVGHLIGQYVGAAAYDLSTRSGGGSSMRSIGKLSPLQWVIVASALLAFGYGIWCLIFFYGNRNLNVLVVATLFFSFSSSPIASWSRSIWIGIFNIALCALNIVLYAWMQSWIALAAAFICLFFAGVALLRKQDRAF